jgi:CBS domain containing-hemolysin-like protein
MPVLDVLNRFKSSPLELVLVVDEHGGLQGIVTQTDLLESIAGDLPDSEAGAPEVQEVENGALRINGAMSVHDARERLDLRELPEGELTTVAGLVLSLFGRIPNVGESAEWKGWSFEVAAVDKWRIDAVVARRKVAAPAAEKRERS